MAVTYDRPDPVRDRELLLRMNIDYLAWVCDGVEAATGIAPHDLIGMPLEDYVPPRSTNGSTSRRRPACTIFCAATAAPSAWARCVRFALAFAK